uniref:Uncharacterized protein n=1 Tax=Panagrolaimus davidi TaxID=227884 RepID=A0A914QXS3_9BILA
MVKYRFNGCEYFNLDTEFLKAMFNGSPVAAQRDLWNYVSAPNVAHVHKFIATLGYMFVVQPPKNLKALARRQEFITMILACIGTEGRICDIPQFRKLFKALGYDPNQVYFYGLTEPTPLNTEIINEMLFDPDQKQVVYDYLL